MKRTLSFLLSVVMVLGVFASLPVTVNAADSGICGDNLTWSLDEGTLTISGTGKMYDYKEEWEESNAPWPQFKVKDVIINEGVTSIGDYAFYNCYNLITATIPETVTSVGRGAFSLYYDLCDESDIKFHSVYITDIDSWCNIDFESASSNPLYYGSKLYVNGELATDVVIPDGVTKIYPYGFSCENITSITIPDSVTSIGDDAFSGCSNLTMLTIPDGVTSIGYSAFSGCSSLTSITIPDSVTSIGSGTFSGCSSLVSVTLPDSITSIDNYTFSGCSSLTSITIPEGVTSIGREAFYECNSLAAITIPGTVNYVGKLAFRFCYSIKSVYINDLTSWCNIDFYYDEYSTDSNPLYHGADLYINGELATDIVIPRDVTVIRENTFRNCNSLTSVTIHDDVTDIGDGVFLACENLKTISVSENNRVYSSLDGVLFNKNKTTLLKYPENRENTYFKIPDTVTNIDSKAFYETNIQTLVLGKGVSNIKIETFSGNEYLRKVAIPLEVTSISQNAFNWCYDLEEVFYEGTESQWNNISIASGNDYLIDSRYHYNVDVANLQNHYGEPTKITQPTCTSVGSNKYVCACGYEITEYFGTELGHDYSEDWTIDREATCSWSGWKSRHCSRCDGTTDGIEIDALGHDYSEDWTIDREATCTWSGWKSRHCSRCNSTTDGMEITALGHDYSEEWTIDVEATCKRQGSKSHHCSRCSTKKDVTVIEADASKHSFGAWIVEKEPTCSTAGKRAKLCNVCGDIVYEFIPAIAHTPGGWKIDKEATVNASGKKHQECTVCGDTIKTSKIAQLKCATPKLKSVANVAAGVKFSWNKVTGADNYEIYRKTGSGAWKKIATVKGTVTTYTDKNVKSGTTYKYTVKAKNEAGVSKYNTTGLTIKCLAAPVLKTPTSTKTGVVLKWNKITGAQGYVVYRKTGNGKLVKLATVKGVAKVSYTDKTAKKGTKYTYQIKSYSGKTFSAYSNAKTIKDKY